ncbi:LANO_0G16116g1_1 [Lachancea nothofagi CBS 11611]|uniref:LANO_0G16116g1_1 n=1 Tax=Lachancea nothofagi CBS 11611 TaxID=1266666 RepID=A0A1G4KKH3_9SACH|nr:LANO_0G16116g1_1 [Lachancea nothofagi CBS 11611]
MSLKKWKKIELLDLADKLDLHVSQSSTKAKIADAIDEHLKDLDEALDLTEFPELATYYQESAASSEDESSSDPNEETDDLKNRLKSKVQDAAEAVAGAVSNAVTNVISGSDKDQQGEEDDEGEESGLRLPQGTPFQNWYSKLQFQRISPAEGSFAFKFNEFMQDVQNKTVETNENVQEALSTIPAVDFVFMAIEAYVYLVNKHLEFSTQRPFVTLTSRWQEIGALASFWSVWSLAIPAFVSYYINFIRYDLPDVSVDPMVFHITKALLALLLTQWQPSFVDEATYAVKDVAGDVTVYEKASHWFRFALTEWKLELGLLPFILACAGSALCLYVL